MTDKQMKDKVDVSKCKYHNNGWCLLSESCDQIKYKSCHDMTLFDCYYKQLQAKEQECEMLEKQNDILLGQLVINDGENVTVQISQSQFEEYNQLKAECEALHGYISRLEEELEIEEAEALRADVIMLEKTEEADKYKQALRDIKEICNSVWGNGLDEEVDKFGLILQKCEVIDE